MGRESRFRMYVAVAVALFALVAGLQFLILAAQIDRQRLETQIVNVAGRQRMLTARTARLSDQLLETRPGFAAARLRDRIRITTSELQRNQEVLARGGVGQPQGWPPPAVRTLDDAEPFEINRRIARYGTLARSMSADNRRAEALATEIGRQSDELMPLLDRVVNAYVTDAQRRQDQLIWKEAAAAIVLLTTLALEIAFIFRPLIRTIDRSRRRVAEEAFETKRANEALRNSERRLSLFIEQIPAVLWTTDRNLRFTSSLGGGRAPLRLHAKEVVGQTLQDVINEQDDAAGAVIESHRLALKGESGQYRTAAFGRTYQTHVEPQYDEDGRIIGTIGVSLDVTEQQEAITALKRSEAALAQAQAIARLGSWTYDLRTKDVAWSRHLYELLGVEMGNTVPRYDSLRSFAHPDDAALVRSAVAEAHTKREPYRVDRRIIRSDGAVRWVQQQGEYDYDLSGHAVALTGTMLDITERKHAEERLAFQASHDLTTGLPNRRYLLADIERRLQLASAATRESIAVLYIGVASITSVEGTLGHEASDEFVTCAAQRLSTFSRAGATLAYLEAGTFALTFGSGDQEQGQRTAQDIIDAFASPLGVSLREIYADVSIGIVDGACESDEASELIRNAAAAMWEARNAGRNLARRYTCALSDASTARASLDADLRRAVQEQQFHLNYQPIVAPTGRILGVEALVRWNHHTRGFVPPDAFIPLAEESRLIEALGSWVLGRACNETRWLQSLGFPAARVAVNVSARQLAASDFEDTVTNALAHAGLEPSALELEITESAIMRDVEDVLPLLTRLRAHGIRLSIDDFGTGYSSLAYLRKLPVNKLKIDKAFVRELAANELDGAIARTIIALAHNLGMRVVAEGVETELQLAYLTHLGCDEMQGYFFSRPLPADALLALVRDSQTLPAGTYRAANNERAIVRESQYASRT